MDMDFFKVFLSNDNISFEKAIETLLQGIQDKNKVVNLVFFGSSTDEKYNDDLNIIRLAVRNIFGTSTPLLTYVIQAPDSPNKVSLEVFYKPSFVLSVLFHETVGTRYALMETANSRILMTEGIISNQSETDIGIQVNDIFAKANQLLKQQSMTTNDIVRQWNYIGHITGMTKGTQHYQTFNDARGNFYKGSDWTTNGYPAATGIGMSVQRAIVSFVAISPLDKEILIKPLDNSLQTAAHAYSEKVLICSTDNERHATPKFERAKIIMNESMGVCFISGTAAIRGEQSMNSLDCTLQTRQTLENIQYLISNENLKNNNINRKVSNPSLLRVYVKNKKDMETVRTEVQEHWPETPTLYLEAGICREELLVEIEGVAMVTNN